MKWKSILCIVLTLAAVCSLALIRDSAAWFDTKTGEPLPQEIVVKKMCFDFDGKLASYIHNESDGTDFIITDQNLITDNEGKITGMNHSTIDTEVRFRIVYDMPNVPDKVYTESTEDSDDLIADVDTSYWTQQSDGYYYHTFMYNSTQPDERFTIITNIAFDGTKVTRESYLPETGGSIDPHSGIVRVEIQAKQKDHVTWTDIWSTP